MRRLSVLLIFILLVLFTGVSFAQSPTSVNYDLPYPGILPDHPLYKLKVLRDRITLFLIRDTQKKAEHHLLLADKRIQMANILIDKGKVELAKETALKGENEYTLLVFMFKDRNERPSKELFSRLEKAAQKHQEILKDIISKVGNSDKKTFETVLEFSERNLSELKDL